MKKITTLFTLSVISIGLLSACGQANEAETTKPPSPTEQVETAPSQVPETDNTQEGAESSSVQDSEKITFETTDTNGNVVTSDIFKDYDLTMINVWGTGCVPCIEEMPGLAKFHDQLPENINMFSVCIDYDADPEFAEDVLAQSNVNFATLKVSDSLFDSVLTKAQALPTTIFVDSEGNIVGEVILGAPAVETDEKVVEHYMKYVDEKLGEVT